MLHKTKAIILRSVPYGDTSLIVSAYTELFGIQSYIIKGARKVSKKGGSQVQYLQPAALLDLVVYHNELKHLQLIKEMKWAVIYKGVLSDVTRYSIALYLVELLGRSIKQVETNPELFEFVENTLMVLDEAQISAVANIPLHFSLHLAAKLGFQIEANYDAGHPVLDLREGRFSDSYPMHQLCLDGELAAFTFELLKTDNPITLYRLKLNQAMRRQLLQAYSLFYEYHITDFGHLRSVKVLEELLG